jgi:hypothetical protein
MREAVQIEYLKDSREVIRNQGLFTFKVLSTTRTIRSFALIAQSHIRKARAWFKKAKRR